MTVTVVNKVDGGSIAVNYKKTGDQNFSKVADVPVGGSKPGVVFPAGTALINVAYNKTPTNHQTWYLACTLINPSSLTTGGTLTAVWTNDQGSGPCQVSP